MVAAGPGLTPLYTRLLLRAEDRERGHSGLRLPPKTLGPPYVSPDLCWGPMDPGTRHRVSHAGHLWEAWEHNPPAFDPLITHHHHSELESLLLPIPFHKLREGAPAPPKLQICQDMGLYTASPTHLLEVSRIYACAKTCPQSSRWMQNDSAPGVKEDLWPTISTILPPCFTVRKLRPMEVKEQELRDFLEQGNVGTRSQVSWLPAPVSLLWLPRCSVMIASGHENI